MVNFLQSLRAGRHFNRGQVLAAAQRYEEAAREYDQALALESSWPHVLLHYALLETDRGHFDQARRLLEQALAQRPDSPVYHTFHGWILAAAGDFPAARQSLERARARTPDNKLTLNGEACLLFHQGDPTAAIARLQRDGLCSNHAMQARLLLEVEKALAAGHCQLTGRASPTPDPSSARPLPSSARGCLKRGTRRLEQGHSAEAVALFERARELAPPLPELGFYLGAAYFEAGRYADARRVLEADRKRYSEKNPQDDPQVEIFWLYLAATYLRLGRPEAAEPCLKNLPERVTAEADASFYRGLAALLRGQEQEAGAFFRKALARDGALLQRRLAELSV